MKLKTELSALALASAAAACAAILGAKPTRTGGQGVVVDGL